MPKSSLYTLAPREVELLEKAKANPNLLTGYWFRRPGREMGFQFDENFEPEGAWQLKMCTAAQSLVTICGGVGCSDIDSRIYDAELCRYITIRELIESRRAPVVLSRTRAGWARVKASLPYFKGTGEMARVWLSDGNVVDVSLDHRFLTAERGYLRTRELEPGDALVAPRELPSGSRLPHRQAPGPTRLPVLHNEPGLPIHEREAGDVLARPEPPAVRQSSRDAMRYWQQVLGEACIDLGVTASFDQASGQIAWGYQTASGAAALPQDAREQLLAPADCPPTFEILPEPDQVPDHGWRDYYTPVITKIESLGIRDLYDIHVPVWNNYVMDGVVSHNTGKTLAVGMSACYWGMETEGFKFLNVAQKSWQAHIMWEEIMKWAEGTPFERLIEKAIERPYPKIVIAFRIGDRVYRSSLEFMSVADDAMGIFSWRGDKINIEEAGLIDNLEEVVMNLSTRLTGSTPSGRPFFGQMILISNPWDNPHLWTLFDMARDDPENNLSIALSTRHNKNVTEKQIQNLLKHIPENERSRFLDGTRPEGKGSYFPKTKVYACEDQDASDSILYYANEGAPGYRVHRVRGAGVVEMTSPPEPFANYIILGDPGTKNAPHRDSPVILVWKMPEDFPEHPMELVAFWWGCGDNQIMPFVRKLLAWMGQEADQELDEPVYNPIFVGIDSTGTQKNFAELLNLQIFDEDDLESDKIAPSGQKIVGLDFSGTKKPTYLLSLRLFIENLLMRWPKLLNGVRQQLLNYDPKLDRGIFPKRAQDIVAAFAMSAFVARVLFNVEDQRLLPKALPPPARDGGEAQRDRRLPASVRYGKRKRPLPTAAT